MKDKRFNNVEMLKDNRRDLEFIRFEMEQDNYADDEDFVYVKVDGMGQSGLDGGQGYNIYPKSKVN